MKPYFKIATAALALSLVFTNPLAASAHDEILSTSPSSGETVEAGVIDVSVTFNEDVMTTPGNTGEVIEVTGPDGTDSATWSNGCVEVSGAKISTTVDLDAPGTYHVAWRAVSSDGHPNEGSFDFNLSNSNGYKSGGLVEPSAQCASASPSAVAYESSPANTSKGGSDDEESGMLQDLPYLLIGFALIVIGAIAGLITTRVRARTKRTETE